MSVKPFEAFLAQRFVGWAKQHVKPGFRYQFTSPDSVNSQHLYKAIVQRKTASLTLKNDIGVPVVETGSVQLIPVLHDEQGQTGFTENYISHLRDEVAGQNGQFANTALLVIHNSLLDTLINSANNLGKEQGVWAPDQIKDALSKLIDQNDSSKAVSECLLEYQFHQIVEDGATMFGFESLYKAVDDGI